MRILFATQNKHKLEELAAILPAPFQLEGLTPSVISEELPETGDTLEANALQKARYVFEKTGITCFADDTGLEVAALNGAPGVYSARYAGEQRSAADNMKKLLNQLEGHSDRSARFRTVIAFTDGKQEQLFEGIVSGTITGAQRGTNGFGYDPVFVPDGFDKTFAEMSAAEKNNLSHRARAVEKLVAFLKTY